LSASSSEKGARGQYFIVIPGQSRSDGLARCLNVQIRAPPRKMAFTDLGFLLLHSKATRRRPAFYALLHAPSPPTPTPPS